MTMTFDGVGMADGWKIAVCVGWLVGCEGAPVVEAPVVVPMPVVPEVAPPPKVPALDDPAGLIGWWRGEHTCIELFANGDFELVDNRRPKVMVMGKVGVTAADGGFSLALKTERIWSARFLSNCRKIHRTGAFKEDHGVLGVPFKPGETGTLQLRRTGEATVELCGTACEALTRETPHLGARWRRDNMDYPDRPESQWAAGELLELDIDEVSGHLWIGRAEHKFGRLAAKTVARYVAPDEFVVTVTPVRYDVDVETLTETPGALGVAFVIGGTQELGVRRLGGERVEVCGAANQCVTLARQFDSHAYGFD